MKKIVLPANIDRDTITIDSVFTEMENWRKNRSKYPNRSIPDEIWYKCFVLAEKYSGKRVRTLFSMNTEQYNRKYKLLVSDHGKSLNKQDTSARQNNTTNPLCEVKVEPPELSNKVTEPVPLATVSSTTKSDVQMLKSTRNESLDSIDLKTIIVECIRPDGNRLKIHATNKSINEVMACFYQRNEV